MPHVTVTDGTSIYYESHGDESLPTLVLIRGTGRRRHPLDAAGARLRVRGALRDLRRARRGS